MSGHSKWAGIKHKKALIDAKRGKLFSKLNKEITVAAKAGGGSTATNPRLRLAVNKAKEANVPNDTIERAIKKGTGELPGVNYEQANYEGYGPGGVAIVVEALTDNKNRTTAEVRNIFSKKGGNLAGTGSVGWLFNKKGFIVVNKTKAEEDKLMSIALDSGAEDLKGEEDSYEITTDVKNYEKVRAALESNKIEWDAAEITMIPSSYVKLQGAQAEQVLSLVEALEDLDDVQNVYANFDIPDEILQQHTK
ncbi:MAG: YebC/PmpR family DNA-binding transcriptional regulator [Candidatus Omnitrophota bacterium]|nr:MAG: YebC/PmpR family DNA-binding transcriptional regulator [Candidatus Omnitrophota bacterium]